MILSVFFAVTVSGAAPIPVDVTQTGTHWSLLRGGAPYALKGVGGQDALPLLARAGGTSIRTWGADEKTGELLDAAHALGLTVSVGIWLGHERHGFDYGDPEQVAKQLAHVRWAVETYKDHPAVLVWGLGNEMEGFESGDSPAVWKAVCDAAALVQGLDPHHPVMTTTADIGGGRIAAVDACPHIDIHGVNSYGGAPSLPNRFRRGGGTKPIVLTEYGPPGVWEIDKTSFGAPPELTSTEKAAIYAEITTNVLHDPQILGGYAFLWSHKTEATATWYGLFLADGTQLGGIDALAQAWGGTVENRAPTATPLAVDGGDVHASGATVRVHWQVADPEGAELTTDWTLRREIVEQTTGGDPQALPPALTDAIVASGVDQATIRLPAAHGVYRLYAVARDPAGAGAAASLPLLVDRVRPPDEPLPLPWWVYQDDGVGGPWIPSGYMGNMDAVIVDMGATEDCASPPTCVAVRAEAGGWSGVAWQFPPDNWGAQPGGQDLGDARWLVFKVREKMGFGTATFGVGLVDQGPHADSLAVKKRVRLTSAWQEVRIRLRGDRSHLITGFWWTLPGGYAKTLYLDDIRFE